MGDMTPETFLAQFGHIADSPNGVQKLRELILDLAVRGKLVPQDPNDEPASELLKRIVTEKAQLVKDGVIKKAKILPDIAKEETPYDLPQQWQWTHMGDLTLIRTGKLDANASSPSGEYPFFTCAKHPLRIDHFVYDCECVLLAGNGNFDVNYYHGKFEAYQRTYIIEPVSKSLSVPYIYKFIQRYAAKLREISIGGVIQYIKIGFLTDALFPLPPLEEQRRIVAKVDQLMALCDRLEAQQKQRVEIQGKAAASAFDALVNSADAEAFTANWRRIATHFDQLIDSTETLKKPTILDLAVRGKLVPQDQNDEPAGELLKRIADEKVRLIKGGNAKKSKSLSEINSDDVPFEVPKHWKWTAFDVLIDAEKPISYGVLVPGPDTPNGIPFVRIADLSLSNPPAAPEKSISKEVDEQYARTRLHGGEILMGVVGSIGKLGIAPLTWKGANIARAICRIEPVREIHKEFVLLLLQNNTMQAQFRTDTRTLAQPTLNIGLIRQAPTPLPPLEEQKRIVAKVDQLMAVCDRLEVQLAARNGLAEKLAGSFTHHLLVESPA
jgi:type I restriction enzyme S subunit